MARGGRGKRAALLVEEWTKSMSTTDSINKLVKAGVVPDATTGGWRPSDGESYPNPNPDELVVFEDYFWHGFGIPIHPFLKKLLVYYKISLCNLHPNSIISISIFIHFCEGYLGIYPHFNLFRHFFYLKKKGGSGGSKITDGSYLVLRDHMKAEYLNVPLNTSMRDWYRKWFYVQQEQELLAPCDVSQMPEAQESWSERPTVS